MSTPDGVIVMDHPLLKVLLSTLRDVNSSTGVFRQTLNKIAGLLTTEATRHFETAAITVATPLTTTEGAKLARPVIIVPILRAGLGLVDGMLPLLSDATIAHIGIARNEDTALPEPYYAKLPATLH
ncbi:MAG: uracil phosphoribosyltransferase [Giesbergeria sp.]